METPTRSATEDTITEHIPWQHLTVPETRERPRILLGVAAVLGLLAVGVIVGRATGLPQSSTEIVPTPSTTEPVGEASPATTALPPPPTTSPLTEADLLADPAVAPAVVATGRAEWFVREYLTRDGSGDAPQRLAVAGGWETPTDGGEGTSFRSYVQWTEPIDVQLVAPGRFAVSVAVGRLLAGEPGASYRRLDPEVLVVEVVVGPDGSRVVDWPVRADAGASEPVAPPNGEAALRLDDGGWLVETQPP